MVSSFQGLEAAETSIFELRSATLSYTTGKGLGYAKGYSTLGTFFNIFSQKSFYPFIDLRAHYFDHCVLSSNIGVGSRYSLSDWQKIWGWNIFYDCSNLQKTSQQIGVGLEFLGCGYDVRINGYIPVGNKKKDSHPPIVFTYPGGYIAKTKIRKKTLAGVDSEIGASLNTILNVSHLDIYGAIGPYYYSREFNDHIIGCRLRFIAAYSKYLSLQLNACYDNYFDHCTQLAIHLSVPLGCDKTSRNPPFKRSNSNYTQAVQRNEIIVNSLKYNVWKVNWE